MMKLSSPPINGSIVIRTYSVGLLAAGMAALLVVFQGPARAIADDRAAIAISPRTSAIDEALAVKIVGLKPHERVTVYARQNRFNLPLQSRAVYAATAVGQVNLPTDAPISGDYSGRDPMGLVWSMRLAGKSLHPDFNPGAEIKPFDVVFQVRREDGSSLVSVAHRYVVSSLVSRTEIRRDGLVATFFAPADKKRHPAVIVVMGSEGGLEEDRAAIVARHGFCTLALAYFGIKPLPRYVVRLPIETVGKAIALLKSMPAVDDRHIAIMGYSKGSEFALIAASYYPTLQAVVAYAPSSAVFQGLRPSGKTESSWTYRGAPLQFANGRVPMSTLRSLAQKARTHQLLGFTAWYAAKLAGASPAAFIRVENIHGPVLLVAGGADNLWPSEPMAHQIMTRLKQKRHNYADRMLAYPDAGHGIGPPYVPTSHIVGPFRLGGTSAANASANARSWVEVLHFLVQNLSNQPQ